MEDIQKDLKYSSLLSYMFKPPRLLTHGFDNNRTSLEKLLKHMCNFGAQEKWMEGRIFFSSYLDVDTTKDQCHLLNNTPLECTADYIMEDTVGERNLKRLPHRRLNFIDVSFTS